jgi:hypothetical protein
MKWSRLNRIWGECEEIRNVPSYTFLTLEIAIELDGWDFRGEVGWSGLGVLLG